MIFSYKPPLSNLEVLPTLFVVGAVLPGSLGARIPLPKNGVEEGGAGRTFSPNP